MLTVAWAPGLTGTSNDHWSFDPKGEDSALKLDPMRSFPGVDVTLEFPGQKHLLMGLGLRRKAENDLVVNRSQKNLLLSRWAIGGMFLPFCHAELLLTASCVQHSIFLIECPFS